MKTSPTVATRGLAGATLRAVAVAAALAGGAGTGMAATAVLKITSFSVTAVEFSGNFAWATDPYQSYSMTAQEGGGLYGSAADPYSADNWNLGLNRLAQTANARATGNTVQFTDGATQLMTAGFNLSGLANPGLYAPATLPNYANASAVQSGAFVLLDDNGNLAAGTITFDFYYDLSVTAPSASASHYAQTALNLLSSSDGGGNASFADGLLSSALAGGTGAKSGHFSWSYTLAVGQAAYYTLSGSAIASAAPVPEPAGYALMGLGLVAVGAVARRRRSTAG